MFIFLHKLLTKINTMKIKIISISIFALFLIDYVGFGVNIAEARKLSDAMKEASDYDEVVIPEYGQKTDDSSADEKHEHEYRGEKRNKKLSDAMKDAADYNNNSQSEHDENLFDNNQHLHRHCMDDCPKNENEYRSTNIIAEPGVHQPSDLKTSRGGYLRFAGGISATGGDDYFKKHNHGDLAIGFYSDGNSYSSSELYIGFSRVDMNENSSIHNSIKSEPVILEIGIKGYGFGTQRNAFLGPYAVAGISYSQLFWEYRRYVKGMDGYIINSDSVPGLGFCVGIGMILGQNKHFEVGSEILGNIIYWGPKTYEGFENDVFDSICVIKYRVNITIK